MRRRRRRPPRRGREEGEVGDCAGGFAEKPLCFCGIANRSLAGLRVSFPFREVFFVKPSRGCVRAVGSSTDGGDRVTVVLSYSNYYSQLQRSIAERPPKVPSLIYR